MLPSASHTQRAYDVILTLVGLALLPELAGRLDGGLGPVLVEVIVRHDLTANELVLEVGAERAAVRASIKHNQEIANWMTPAACGALVPLRMVQARTSSGPQVK
jgi:hypothetical protein